MELNPTPTNIIQTNNKDIIRIIETFSINKSQKITQKGQTNNINMLDRDL